MDRQFYSDSSRKICFALIVVYLLLGSVSVLKHFIVHEGGAFIASLKSMPFYPAKNQPNSIKISSSLRRLQSHPLRILTNLAEKSPPAPAQTSLDSHGCERECGIIFIPYPFGLSPECARSSAFQLNTQSNSALAKQNLQDPVGPWPFLSVKDVSFQVINISSRFLIINATNIKAILTPPLQSDAPCDNGTASLVLDPHGPYHISPANLFFVAGCNSVGSYTLEYPSIYSQISYNAVCGPLSCNHSYGYVAVPVCNADCCTLSLDVIKQIFMKCSAGSRIYYDGNGICGFCTIAYPESYSTWDADSFGVGQYGVQLLWAIDDYYSCDDARSKPDYACTPHPASCVDVFNGYVCECTMAGYHGDGFRNGSGCSDIDECANASSTMCAVKATCTNFAGAYNCSCKNGLKGDGYSNGTGCSHSKSHVALIAGISNGVGILLIANVTIIWFLLKRWKNGLHDRFEPSNVSFHDALMEIQKQDGANACRLFSLKN